MRHFALLYSLRLIRKIVIVIFIRQWNGLSRIGFSGHKTLGIISFGLSYYCHDVLDARDHLHNGLAVVEQTLAYGRIHEIFDILAMPRSNWAHIKVTVLRVPPTVKNKLAPSNSNAPLSGVVKFVPGVNFNGALSAAAAPAPICTHALGATTP